jgi:2-haloacid dehalogenase
MTIEAIVFDAYGTLYDVQSVEGVINGAFPGHGAFITQIWRMKQLEYTWLRSMMGRYEDFWQITKDSLAFALDALGLTADPALFAQIAEAYNNLTLYPEAKAALAALSGYRLAILSNGSPDMLNALVRNSGLAINATISVDAKRVYKPDPRAYALVEESLGVTPDRVLFVSSNGFDISGAKSFGFRVVRIERVTQAALRSSLSPAAAIGPLAVFKTMRTQAEILGFAPDAVAASLEAIAGLAARGP